MKILLIDNSTELLQQISDGLKGHDVEIVHYRPGVKLSTRGKDLVILSGGGGAGRELYDLHHTGDLWYKDEIDFILDCDKPILGICMGFEIIAHAYGSKLQKLPKKIAGLKRIQTGPAVYIKQYKEHQWCIPTVSEEHFEILATSKTGVEMVRHKTKPILATQFHPEVAGGELNLEHLIKKLESFSMARST